MLKETAALLGRVRWMPDGLSCLLVNLQSLGANPPKVLYRLSYVSPGSTQVHVRVDSTGDAATPRTFLIRRAVPMGYGEEPYDRFVSNVRAFDGK